MPTLTRRRSTDAPRECWQVYFGDVRVGTIGRRAGQPHDEDSWEWICGFYPGSEPGEYTNGTGETFEQAREEFEAAWLVFLSHRREADFQAWRNDRDWHARKYAMWQRGERLPSQEPSSLMRCACGETFDSHRLEQNLIHVPHITAAKATDGIRRR
jgi:hypothetical protein